MGIDHNSPLVQQRDAVPPSSELSDCDNRGREGDLHLGKLEQPVIIWTRWRFRREQQ